MAKQAFAFYLQSAMMPTYMQTYLCTFSCTRMHLRRHISISINIPGLQDQAMAMAMDIVIKAKKARAAVASYLQAMMPAPTYLCSCRKSDRPGKGGRLERGMGFIIKGRIQARSRSRAGGGFHHQQRESRSKGRCRLLFAGCLVEPRLP